MLRHLSTITAKEKELETVIAELRTKVQSLKFDLGKEQSLHANTTFYAQELMRELKVLKSQCSELTDLIDRLLKEWVELKEDNEGLRKVVSNLQDHAKDTHNKMMNLINADKKLEEDCARIMSQGPPLTKAVRQQIITEYKESPELTEVVVRQFSEGYQDAKARMRERMWVAGLDPKVLDSSDEENEAEEPSPLFLLNY